MYDRRITDVKKKRKRYCRDIGGIGRAGGSKTRGRGGALLIRILLSATSRTETERAGEEEEEDRILISGMKTSYVPVETLLPPRQLQRRKRELDGVHCPQAKFKANRHLKRAVASRYTVSSLRASYPLPVALSLRTKPNVLLESPRSFSFERAPRTRE